MKIKDHTCIEAQPFLNLPKCKAKDKVEANA